MKKFIVALFTIYLAACAGSSGGSTTATTVLDQSCLNGSAYCNNQAYNSYYGFSSYPGYYPGYNYTTSANGYCSCSYGSVAVYNSSMGLGCVQSNLASRAGAVLTTWSSYGYNGWEYAAPAPQWQNNQPEYSNVPGSAYPGSCQKTLQTSCFLGQANTCPTGTTCRAIIANSNLGICGQ
jgi:hypothetical protein